jgi:hypothetical protein
MASQFSIRSLSRAAFILLCLTFSLNVFADDDTKDSDSPRLTITRAKYNTEKHRLEVKIQYKGKKPYQIELFEPASNTLLFSKKTKKSSLKIKLKNLDKYAVPCVIEARVKDLTTTRKVKHSPTSCNDGSKNESSDHSVTQLKIEDAKYEDARLTVKGEFKGRAPKLVQLFDTQTGQKLAEQQPDDDAEHFKFKLSGLSPVPCEVTVKADDASASKEVEHAPEDCSTPPPPTPQNHAPLCAIISPAENTVKINLGKSALFAGQASDPDGDPITFEWDFNGGADSRPNVLSPGAITFDVNNGSFLVHFIVTDDKGARCTASMTVVVGTPPVTGNMVPQQPAPGTAAAGDGNHVVLPANDLGMHCADLGSYPFEILPPFNTVNAYAIKKGTTGANKPLILDASSVTLRYSASSNPNDPVGPDSINSTSQNFPLGNSLADATIGKTDFWDHLNNGSDTIAALLFPGLNPVPDEGLLTLDNVSQGHGRYMPGIAAPYQANDPQEFSKFVPEFGWHTAQGIPLTNVDDKGRLNSYPLMRIQAIDNTTGQVVATNDVVTPVSAEVDCRDCHTAGKVGADSQARNNALQFMPPASNNRLDVEQAAKKNILMLHDFKHGTDFIDQDKPVLCAGCHRSNALASVGGPAGDPTLDNMSNVMHGFHGRLQLDSTGKLLRDFAGEPILLDPQNQTGVTKLIPFGPNVPMEENCFLCHPGKITQCFRGAMYTAGQKCDDCHGDLIAVGGEVTRPDGSVREPWVDEPECGSCHTGMGNDPVGHLAFAANDPSATPLPAKTQRFNVNDKTLYRNSLDSHAKLGCESCHGSPHAIWPNRNPDANDNVTAKQLQGHTGTITECTTCHEANSFPNGTLAGPHGMHPVNDPFWNEEDGHSRFAKRNGDQCAACHGADHLGTRLAKVPVDRVLRDTKGKILTTLKAGDQVSCDLCHSLKKSFDD